MSGLGLMKCVCVGEGNELSLMEAVPSLLGDGFPMAFPGVPVAMELPVLGIEL